MAEYIEREAAIKMMRGSAIAKYPLSFSIGIMAAADELQKMPAADVAPVRHGRWEKSRKYKGYCSCSVCHDCYIEPEWVENLKWKYCPTCGAKMDGDWNG